MRVTLREALHRPPLEVMNFLNEVTLRHPDAISFAPGRPAEAFFDVAHALPAIARFAEHCAQKSGRSAAAEIQALGQYGRTNGSIAELIARHLEIDEGIRVDPAAVMVTTGAQEAMTVALLGLFEPGRDVLLASDPVYIGITGMAAILGIDLCPVPCGDAGLEPEALRAAIAAVRAAGKNPRALYDIPDFHNPRGVSMPRAHRERVLAIAAEAGLLIFEDNPYGMFAYDSDDRTPTLKALDRDGVVVYFGTFSKTIFPGLRVGYLVADQPVERDGTTTLLADELSKVKSLTTVNTSALSQAVVGGVLLEQRGSLRELVRPKLEHYRANRDAMLGALARHFDAAPAGVHWNRPAGGFFLSVTLPFAFRSADVQTCAQDRGVIVCPMSYFATAPGCENQVRLAFSYVTPAQIDEGIARFAGFVRATQGRS